MKWRILETLVSHNTRMERERESREQRYRDEAERVRRVQASGRPTGITCPVCVHELGDGDGWSTGGYESSTSPFRDVQSQQSVLCPNCGYKGWRIIYAPRPDNPYADGGA